MSIKNQPGESFITEIKGRRESLSFIQIVHLNDVFKLVYNCYRADVDVLYSLPIL